MYKVNIGRPPSSKGLAHKVRGFNPVASGPLAPHE